MTDPKIMDAQKVRLYIEGVGDAEVVNAFIDPRSKRWAYRVRIDGKTPKQNRTRIIYPDQIEKLEWTVRGEMELQGESPETRTAQASSAVSPLLGGGSVSLGSRIMGAASAPPGNNMSSHTHPSVAGK